MKRFIRVVRLLRLLRLLLLLCVMTVLLSALSLTTIGAKATTSSGKGLQNRFSSNAITVRQENGCQENIFRPTLDHFLAINFPVTFWLRLSDPQS